MEGLVVGREVNEDRSHVEKSGQHEGQCPNAVCVCQELGSKVKQRRMFWKQWIGPGGQRMH